MRVWTSFNPPTARRSRRPRRRAIARCARGWSRFAQELPRRASGLVERAGAGVRRSRRVAGDRRPRAGQAWREPHRAAVHRRLCRRAAVRDAAQIRAGRGRVSRRRRSDGLRLDGAIILNAVKCLPPANKPTPQEIATCRNYFEAALASLPNVRVVVALGQIAHRRRGARAWLAAVVDQIRAWRGACHARRPGAAVELPLLALQPEHRRLDAAMFESVFARACALRR